jgi:hypothetical protein
VIVAMSMADLANAITTSVLERTREIGIFRRIFTTEGVALALAGWLLGIPLGYVSRRRAALRVSRLRPVQIESDEYRGGMRSTEAEDALMARLSRFGISSSGPSHADVERTWQELRAFADEPIEDLDPDDPLAALRHW